MNIQQLEYFLDAAKTLNFTRTAEKFYISQSAITQQIRSLERELDVSLFRRVNRKLYLTDAGEIFVGEARTLIARTAEAIERVQSVKRGNTGQLRIGYLQAMELGDFPKSIENFHMKYPGVKLHLERLTAQELVEGYAQEKFDAVFNISREYDVYPDAERIPLRTCGFSLALPVSHRLAARKCIRQSDLSDEALIMRDCGQFLTAKVQTTMWHALDPKLYENIISVENDAETMLVLVAAGVGLAVLPDFDLSERRKNLNISYVPLDTGGYEISICLYYNRNNKNPALPLFVAECGNSREYTS